MSFLGANPGFAPRKDIKRQSPRDQLGSRGLRIVNWFHQPAPIANMGATFDGSALEPASET